MNRVDWAAARAATVWLFSFIAMVGAIVGAARLLAYFAQRGNITALVATLALACAAAGWFIVYDGERHSNRRMREREERESRR